MCISLDCTSILRTMNLYIFSFILTFVVFEQFLSNSFFSLSNSEILDLQKVLSIVTLVFCFQHTQYTLHSDAFLTILVQLSIDINSETSFLYG